MIKVIYFDEGTATDYLDIKYGGKFNSIEEKMNERAQKALAKMDAQAGASLKFLQVFKAAFNSSIGAEASMKGSNILKTTLSNTILSDFIEDAAKDDNHDISTFTNYKLTAKKDSFAFAKMYSPYVSLIKEEIENMEITKLDEVLKNAKGYYELIGKKQDKRIVLRFNIAAFRNNYGLNDLIKMNLTYYAVEVGKCLEDDLLMQNEMTEESNEINIFDIYNDDITTNDSYLSVYDVILAGIVK